LPPFPVDFDVVKCSSCGLVFINPRPPKNALNRFTQEYFGGFYEGVLPSYLDNVCHRLTIAREILSRIENVTKLRGGKILELDV